MVRGNCAGHPATAMQIGKGEKWGGMDVGKSFLLSIVSDVTRFLIFYLFY
jgi:hypothetical protein